MVFVCSFGAVGTVDRTPETRRLSLAYAFRAIAPMPAPILLALKFLASCDYSSNPIKDALNPHDSHRPVPLSIRPPRGDCAQVLRAAVRAPAVVDLRRGRQDRAV